MCADLSAAICSKNNRATSTRHLTCPPVVVRLLWSLVAYISWGWKLMSNLTLNSRLIMILSFTCSYSVSSFARRLESDGAWREAEYFHANGVSRCRCMGQSMGGYADKGGSRAMCPAHLHFVSFLYGRAMLLPYTFPLHVLLHENFIDVLDACCLN